MGSSDNMQTFDKILDMKLTKNDILLVTYPRSGTTFTRQFLMSLVDQINGLDPEKILTDPEFNATSRACFLEFRNEFDSVEQIPPATHQKSRRRILKTHLPAWLAPKILFDQTLDPENQPKIVLVIRNPVDVCNSYYNFHKNHSMWGEKINSVKIENFFDYFLDGQVVEGNWADWHNSWLKSLDKINLKNFHILHYEDLVQDFENSILDLSKFLNLGDIDLQKDVIDQIEIYKKVTKVENMQNQYNHRVFKNFIGPGKVGHGRQLLNESQVEILRDQVKNRLVVAESVCYFYPQPEPV